MICRNTLVKFGSSYQASAWFVKARLLETPETPQHRSPPPIEPLMLGCCGPLDGATLHSEDRRTVGRSNSGPSRGTVGRSSSSVIRWTCGPLDGATLYSEDRRTVVRTVGPLDGATPGTVGEQLGNSWTEQFRCHSLDVSFVGRSFVGRHSLDGVKALAKPLAKSQKV